MLQMMFSFDDLKGEGIPKRQIEIGALIGRVSVTVTRSGDGVMLTQKSFRCHTWPLMQCSIYCLVACIGLELSGNAIASRPIDGDSYAVVVRSLHNTSRAAGRSVGRSVGPQKDSRCSDAGVPCAHAAATPAEFKPQQGDAASQAQTFGREVGWGRGAQCRQRCNPVSSLLASGVQHPRSGEKGTGQKSRWRKFSTQCVGRSIGIGIPFHANCCQSL